MSSDKDNAQIPAEALMPKNLTIESLRQAAAGCKACELWKVGTQTVFGEGKAASRAAASSHLRSGR
jgi:DNA polymerase